MVTGWHKFADKTVYYGTDGARAHGEQNIGGKWYYFDEANGSMVTGWHDFSTKRVYYGTDGTMVYGDQVIEGKKYYFLPGTGALYFGERLVDGKWYYYDQDGGAMVTGWHEFPTKTVYYDENGAMVYGERNIEGKWYYFDLQSGGMATGWHKFPTKTVYYDENGAMVYGERNIEGKWHYFDLQTGAMVTGWHKFPNKTVYYNMNGEMVYGEQTISGKEYYFDTTTGAMLTNTWVNGNYYGTDGVKIDNSMTELTRIAGTSQASVAQMVAFYEKNYNKSYPYPSQELSKGGAEDIWELATIFYEESVREGIRAEVAWTQAMKETGYLKFGGDVSVTQFNFAGLGATGNVSGADFSVYGIDGVRMGVRAQIQHLKAYATPGLTADVLKTECVDPRFNYVTKGSAIYVEWLGIQENPNGTGWAAAEGYGFQIVEMIDDLLGN